MACLRACPGRPHRASVAARHNGSIYVKGACAHAHSSVHARGSGGVRRPSGGEAWPPASWRCGPWQPPPRQASRAPPFARSFLRPNPADDDDLSPLTWVNAHGRMRCASAPSSPPRPSAATPRHRASPVEVPAGGNAQIRRQGGGACRRPCVTTRQDLTLQPSYCLPHPQTLKTGRPSLERPRNGRGAQPPARNTRDSVRG